jgi:hypothetical protein
LAEEPSDAIDDGHRKILLSGNSKDDQQFPDHIDVDLDPIMSRFSTVSLNVPDIASFTSFGRLQSTPEQVGTKSGGTNIEEGEAATDSRKSRSRPARKLTVKQL